MSINPVSIDPNAAVGEFDAEAVERAVHALLIAVGEDPTRDGLN